MLASLVGLAFGVAALAFAYSIGVFIGPLGEEFGWTRQQILSANAFVGPALVVATPAVGWISDRYGVRKLIVTSQIVFGLSFILLGTVTTNLWTFYAIFVLIGFGASGTIAVTFSKVLTREFVRHRGLALGIAMSGTGICGFAVPPFAAWVIENFGWRMGYMALGLLPLLLALPLALMFLHDNRADADSAGKNSDTGTASESPTGIVDDSPLQVFMSYRFWAMAMVFTLASSVMTALITNFVEILGDQGVPTTRAAAVAGTFGIAVIVGRIIVGGLIDRIWAPMVGFALFVPAAIATALLGTNLPLELTVLAIFVAGFAAGAEVDLMGFLVARYFGLRHFGKVYAGLYVGFALGPAICTPIFGGARDALGSYEIPLYAAAAVMFVSAVLLITLGPYPDPDSREPISH